MRNVPVVFAALTVLGVVGPASAQDSDRFRLERTENGFVRMDTRTGAMSFCEERSGELACKSAADGQTTGTGQVDALVRRIEELEKRLAALEGRSLQPDAGLPTEEEFEQTMTFMERFLRRFWGVARDLERESETDRPTPAPDRT